MRALHKVLNIRHGFTSDLESPPHSKVGSQEGTKVVSGIPRRFVRFSMSTYRGHLTDVASEGPSRNWWVLQVVGKSFAGSFYTPTIVQHAVTSYQKGNGPQKMIFSSEEGEIVNPP